MENLTYAIPVFGIIALVFAFMKASWVNSQDMGTDRMKEICGYVREGANAYLRQQYIVVTGFFVVIVILLSIAAFGLGVQSKFVPFAFLTGGFFSGLAGWIGMRTATMASNRTTEGARNSLNQGLQVAFRSGAVMGLTVVGLGLLDITIWFGFLYWIWPMLGQEPLSLVDITVRERPRVAAVNAHEMMYAASLPKIAILLGAFQKAAEGGLELTDENRRLLTDMIRRSSNSAATAPPMSESRPSSRPSCSRRVSRPVASPVASNASSRFLRSTCSTLRGPSSPAFAVTLSSMEAFLFSRSANSPASSL